MRDTINLNKSFITGLKEAYTKAVKERKTSFFYGDHEFITSYAKYFIEFYGPKFDIKP